MRRLDRAPQAAARKVGLNIAETAVDDPEPGFHENYLCGAMCNHTGYCYLEIDNMVDAGRPNPISRIASTRCGRPERS
jgi:hypothetical protein